MGLLAKLVNFRDYFKAHPPVAKPPVVVKPQTRPGPTYPLSALLPDKSIEDADFPKDVRDDRMFLQRMDTQYRVDLQPVPGAHQLYFDLLADDRGQTFWQSNDKAFHSKVNWVISDTIQFGPPLFNLTAYRGRLRAIYDDLVAAKLGR